MNVNVDKILEWKQMASQLKQIKEAEAKMRREIVSEICGDEYGSKKVVVEGYEIKANNKVTTSLDAHAFMAIDDELTAEEKLAVKHTPSLIMANYKKLPSHSLLHDAVVVKPAMPTLSIDTI